VSGKKESQSKKLSRDPFDPAFGALVIETQIPNKIMKTALTSTSALGLSFACALALIPGITLADQIWEQRYDGPAHSNDMALAVAVDSAGNAAVTGKSLNTNGNFDFYTAKYAAADGHLLWEQRYDGPNHADDVATAVVVDTAGNVIVTGYSADFNSVDDPDHIGINTKFYTAKYDAADGNLIWYHQGPDHGGLGSPAGDNIRAALDASGNVIIANHDTVGAYTAKYDATDGHLVWEHRSCRACSEIGFGLGDVLMGVAVDGSGNAVVCGNAVSAPYPGNVDFYTAKYDAVDGHTLWEQFYDDPDHLRDDAVGVAVDSAGEVAVTGTSHDAQGNVYYHTEKYAANGRLLWQRDFQTPIAFSTTKVALDTNGNVIISGTSSLAVGASYDFYTAKYDAADGHLVWERRFDNCANWAYQSVWSLYTLALDGAGNAVVTGGAHSPGNSPAWDFYTTKYAANDGHVLWQQRYEGPTRPPGAAYDHYSFATAVAVDSEGNAIVTGFSENANGTFENKDYATVKYDNLPASSPHGIHCPANIVEGTDPGQCSAVVNFALPSATDECGNLVTVTASPPSGSAFPKGTTTVICTASDGSQCRFTVTVTNAAPAATIAGPPSGAVYPVGAPVSFTGSFSDNAGDTHTAQWLFDSFPVTATVNEANGQVSAGCTFSSPGVYLVQLRVTDSCGNTATASTVSGLPAMVVIYDPNGGSVTGGGWLNSPAGAYTSQPTLTGKASFGFVSKYQKGATVPVGETEFQFQVANFNFHSSSYEWLVISGARAQYKGSGTANNAGSYGFILTAIDGQVSGGGGVDKFRIKIWDKSNHDAIVYDNQLGASDSGDPTTAIAGGSIVIHK